MEMTQPGIETLQLIETNIPDELKNLPHWCVWRYETLDGKKSKPSFDVKTGYHASSTRPETWSTYEKAAAFFLSHSQDYNGLTFALTLDVGIIAIDLDHCIYTVSDTNARKLQEYAKTVGKLAHSYTEESPGREGLHIFLKGKIPGTKRKGIAEMYGEKRFITITGRKVSDAEEIREDQEAIDQIYDFVMTPEADKPKNENKLSYTYMTAPDEEVRRKAENARNGYKFTRLWNGDASGYYKDNKPNEIDTSKAHLALCSYLAYWSNSDILQIDRMFRNSQLYLLDDKVQEKWGKPHNAQGETYGEMTIKRAIAELRKY